MKKCPVCQTRFKDTTKKCRYCNELLVKVTPSEQKASVRHSHKRPRGISSTDRRAKLLKLWNKYWYWAYIVFVLIIILVIGFQFISQKSDVNKSTVTSIKGKPLNFGEPDITTPEDVRQSPENLSVGSGNLAKVPYSAEEWNNKALTLWVDGKYSDPTQAIEYFNNAIKLQPEYAKTYYNRGIAYHVLGQYQRAIEDYSEAIRLKEDYVNAFYNRGTAYLNLGNNNFACIDLQKACELGKCDQLENAKNNKLCP